MANCVCNRPLEEVYCAGDVDAPGLLTAVNKCGKTFEKVEVEGSVENLDQVLKEMREEAPFIEELAIGRCHSGNKCLDYFHTTPRVKCGLCLEPKAGAAWTGGEEAGVAIGGVFGFLAVSALLRYCSHRIGSYMQGRFANIRGRTNGDGAVQMAILSQAPLNQRLGIQPPPIPLPPPN